MPYFYTFDVFYNDFVLFDKLFNLWDFNEIQVILFMRFILHSNKLQYKKK